MPPDPPPRRTFAIPKKSSRPATNTVYTAEATLTHATYSVMSPSRAAVLCSACQPMKVSSHCCRKRGRGEGGGPGSSSSDELGRRGWSSLLSSEKTELLGGSGDWYKGHMSTLDDSLTIFEDMVGSYMYGFLHVHVHNLEL